MLRYTSRAALAGNHLTDLECWPGEIHLYVIFKMWKILWRCVYFSHHPAASLIESSETGKIHEEWMHLFFSKMMWLRWEKKKKKIHNCPELTELMRNEVWGELVPEADPASLGGVCGYGRDSCVCPCSAVTQAAAVGGGNDLGVGRVGDIK